MGWDEYIINIAEQVKLNSKDIKTHIGVVLAGRNFLPAITRFYLKK